MFNNNDIVYFSLVWIVFISMCFHYVFSILTKLNLLLLQF